MNYSEQLKDPRWVRKRNKILRRDGYKCTACGNKGELHVHHTYYLSYTPPWMYPDYSLITLCSSCHNEYHLHHEIITRDGHVPSTKKKQPKKSSRKKKFIKKKDPDISQKAAKRRHNNYAWNKAVDENIERLKKMGDI